MKYADFLNESKNYENTKKLEIEEFKKIYSTLDNKEPFYRGMKNAPSEMMLVDGSKRERKSIGIGNYYTMGFDKINPSYPKRSNGIFFSGTDNTSYFGSLYYVFPLNNVKIASINNKDMWGASIRLPKSDESRIDMKQFVDTLGYLGVSDSSLDSMIKDIKKIVNEFITENKDIVDKFNPKSVPTSKLELLLNRNDNEEFISTLFEHNPDSVHDEIHRLFSADNLYADLYKSAKDTPEHRGAFEHWTDGKVLIIDSRLFNSIKKDL